MEMDGLGYGEYFVLLAENDEVVDRLIDSLEQRLRDTQFKIDMGQMD